MLSRKVVLLGDSSVGKSSIVLRFVKDQFHEYQETTIGAAFLTQQVTTNDGSILKYEIWDTAGQERYKSLAPMYYRNAHLALVCFDTNNAITLEKAKEWIQEVHQHTDCIICLVGNKTDLPRECSGEELAKELQIHYKECSAKNGTGVKDIFKDMGILFLFS